MSMIGRTAVALLTVVLCIGCETSMPPSANSGTFAPQPTSPPETPPAQPARRGPTEEEAANNRERPFRQGVAALEAYRRGSGSKEAVLKEIAELESQTGMFQTVQLYDYANTAREWHTSLAFAFAEAALKKGELDAADRVYRRLIEFYVGSAYSGIRDRARLGIDDVREVRRTAPKKAPVSDSQRAQ